MAKRFYKPCGQSDPKKPRLDVTMTQQFLPLSQNTVKPSSTKATINDSDALWGDDDDDDDEILMQVSQAFEEVADVDTSAFPDYSMCMKPRITSTQLSSADGHTNIGKFEYLKWGDKVAQQPLIRIPAPGSHVKTNEGLFKKPSNVSRPNQFSKQNGTSNHQPMNIKQVSLSLNRHPQFEPEVTTKGNLEACKQELDGDKEILEDLGLGNVSINHNNQCILKQLVELRKQNDKFQMEQIKLRDQCITKEGEVTLLRAKLKSAATVAESARLQRIHSHEQQQRQWNDKIAGVQAEARALQAELEFKNMEISKVKEKCKQLETAKPKAPSTESPRTAEKRGFCQRLNDAFNTNERPRKILSTYQETLVQTETITMDDRLHIAQKEYFTLKDTISEAIFDTSLPEKKPFLSCLGDSFSAGYAGCAMLKRKLLKIVPSSRRISRKRSCHVKLDSLYTDLASLVKLTDERISEDECTRKCLKIALIGKEMLLQARDQLEALTNKINLSILRKMDELYLQYTSLDATLNLDFDLYSAKGIHEKEQCIELRRVMSVVSALCAHSTYLSEYVLGLRRTLIEGNTAVQRRNENYKNFDEGSYMSIFLDLCRHIGNIGCANIYCGLLASISEVLHGSTLHTTLEETQLITLFSVIKEIVFSRPPAVTIRYLLKLISKLSTHSKFLILMCRDDIKPLNIELNQGVVTYTKDNCFIHILSSQVEVCLRQLESSQMHIDDSFKICSYILTLSYNSSLQRVRWSYGIQDRKCHCPVKFVQCVILALKLCVKHYKEKQMWIHDKVRASKFRIVLSEGLMILYLWSLRDAEFLIKLGEYEGYYQMFVETCKELEHQLVFDNIHVEALAELSSGLESSSDNEDLQVGLSIWEQGLDNFHSTD